MGRHVGWTITTTAPGRFLARARDPAAGRYVARRFRDRGEARAWAASEHAKFLTRMKSLAVVSTAELVADYQAAVASRGRCAAHQVELGKILDAFAQAVPDLGQLRSAERCRTWLEEQAAGLAPATRNRYLSHVRALTAWAVAQGRLLGDPLGSVERVREPRTLKAQFTVEELQTLARAIDDPYHLRFALQLWAGLRCSEAHALTWEQVDLEGRVIEVRQGKGAKDRLVPIQRELVLLLAMHRDQGPLFDQRLRQINTRQQGRDLAAFCTRQGIELGERSPHSLRHCYAGLQTATGTPSIMLAAWMGHVSMATTAHYAQMAMRYHAAAEGWTRGEFELWSGWRSVFPQLVNDPVADAGDDGDQAEADDPADADRVMVKKPGRKPR